MHLRDLLDREILAEIDSECSRQDIARDKTAGAAACTLADLICIQQAVEHASNENYAAALTLTLVGAANLFIAYLEARSAYVLKTAPLKELKPPVLGIEVVRDPVEHYIDD